jgi:protein-disulfide isomerase
MEQETNNTPSAPEQKNEVKKNATISIPAAIISGAVIIAIALIIVLGSNGSTPKNAAPAAQQPAEVTEVPADVATVRPNDNVRGDLSKAEVAIIEYSDSDCPYCIKFHPTLQQIYSEYDGKVAWVYRYFPLTSLHPNAATEAVALECVAELGGNDAFNKYLDTIINVTLNPDPKSNEALTTYATAQGIDGDLFKTCIAGTNASDRVKADSDEAEKIGAQGTPFSIAVNLKTGKQIIIPGAYPYADVKADIDSLLK